MVKNRNVLTAYKLFFALLGFSAIVTEVAVIVERGVFNPVNFFSYFTIETNILVFITLLLSALATAAGRRSRAMDTLRGLSTVFIIVVGIGFAVLLSGLEGVMLTAVPWDNIVLHYIIPVAVLIDYIVDRPSTKLVLKKSLVWLVFPLVYVLYSLIRGSLTGWYPYPFLNPTHAGYGHVAGVVAGLLVLSIVLVWIVCRFSGKKR